MQKWGNQEITNSYTEGFVGGPILYNSVLLNSVLLNSVLQNSVVQNSEDGLWRGSAASIP